MKIYSVTIENFRGIRSAKLTLPDHAVLIGEALVHGSRAARVDRHGSRFT
jgi:predicted ATPase